MLIGVISGLHNCVFLECFNIMYKDQTKCLNKNNEVMLWSNGTDPSPMDMVVLRKPIEQINMCPMARGFLTVFDKQTCTLCMLTNNVPMGWSNFFVLAAVNVNSTICLGEGEMGVTFDYCIKISFLKPRSNSFAQILSCYSKELFNAVRVKYHIVVVNANHKMNINKLIAKRTANRCGVHTHRVKVVTESLNEDSKTLVG